MSFRISSLRSQGSRLVNLSAKRTKSDLVVRKTTNEPLVSQGPVGRQAWNGRTATVFGATGFLGRYVVSKLAREGTKVIVPYRGLKEHTRHLIPQGDLGMVTQIECDLRIPRQLEEAMIHSDLVINLAGRNYETKNFTLEKVHIQGAMDIATTAQELGVARFIHVSRLGADASSPSEILSCKAKGEHMVRECYPDATIVRPAAMYGYEDELLNNIGYWKTFYIMLNSQTKLRPVNVEDVSKAIVEMGQNEWTLGKTFELYNPREYTKQDIVDLVSLLLREKVNVVHIPKPILRRAAQLLDILPYHYTSPHEVDLMDIDEIPTANSEIYGFKDLGIEPQMLEVSAMKYIRHYRAFNNENVGMEINPRAFRK